MSMLTIRSYPSTAKIRATYNEIEVEGIGSLVIEADNGTVVNYEISGSQCVSESGIKTISGDEIIEVGLRYIGSVSVDTWVPSTGRDTFPTHLALLGKGGWREVESIAERNAIPSARREAGMAVYVTSEQKLYILNDDLETWTLFETGKIDTISVNGEVQPIDENKNVDITVPLVENSVTSTSTTEALSANMGYELQQQISQLKGLGRYLSVWDCTTGLPQTDPTVVPYEYRAGDYYIVGNAVHAESESLTGTQIVGEGLSLTVDPDTSRQSRFYADLKTLIGEPLTDVNIYAVYTKNNVTPIKYSSASGDTSIVTLSRQGSAYVKQLEVKALLESMEISDYESFIGTSIRVHKEGSKGKILVYGVYRSTEGYDTQTTALEVYTRETEDGEDPVEGIKKIIEDEWYIKITGDLVLGPVWSCTVYKLSIGDSGSPINWVYDINIGGTRTGWLDPFIIEGTPEEGDVVRVSYRTEKINYKPNGTEYTGEPSTTIEDREVSIDDSYIYDGLVWHLLSNAQKEITFSSIVGSPYDNTNLAGAFDEKQDVLTAGTNIIIEEDAQTGDLVISSTAQESFFRGRWANWSMVPSINNLYPEDYHGNRTPTDNDYMVVSDASDYTSPGEEIVFERIEPRQDDTYLKVIYKGYETYFPSNGAIRYLEPNNTIGAYTSGTPTTIYLKSYSAGKIIFNGITYNENVYVRISDDIGGMNVGDKIIAYTEGRNDKLGTWRFKYSGDWASVGKSGWIPEYQLEDVLPIATDTIAGISKLYTTTGSNIDGTMDQNSITTELGQRVLQLSELPEATSENLGTIVQYTGLTDPTTGYTHAFFYKSVLTHHESEVLQIASTSSSTLMPSDITIDAPTWRDKVNVSGTYIFTYDGTDWSLDNTVVDLSEYGLTIDPSATVSTNDSFEVAYEPEVNVYSWEQIDVQPATDLIWGNISGTLSDQEDLQEELNKKSGVIFLYIEDDEESE